MHRRNGKRQRGFLLLTSLFLVAGLLTLTTVGLTRSMTELSSASLFVAKTQAFHNADAGLDFVLWEYNGSGGNFLPAEGWSAISCPADFPPKARCVRQTIPLSTGNCTVTIHGWNRYAPVVTLIGSALPSANTATVEATLWWPRSGLPHAMFGDIWVKVQSQGKTDSYDASLPYDPATAQPHGDVATNSLANGSVDISGVLSTTVSGDASIGPGGDPNLGVEVSGAGATLTGAKLNLSEDIFLEPVVMPSCDAAHELGALRLIAGEVRELEPGTWCADSIVMDGPTSRLYTTGPVKLFVRDYVSVQYGSKIESDGGPSVRPERLQIYLKWKGANIPSMDPNIYSFCSGRRVCIDNSVMPDHAQVTATLYGADAYIQLFSYTEWYGAVVGQHVIGSSGRVHHADNLGALTTPYGTGPHVGKARVASWRQL